MLNALISNVTASPKNGRDRWLCAKIIPVGRPDSFTLSGDADGDCFTVGIDEYNAVLGSGIGESSCEAGNARDFRQLFETIHSRGWCDRWQD